MPIVKPCDLNSFDNVPETIRALIADPKRTMPLPWYFACLKNRRVKDNTREIVTTFFHKFPAEIRQMILVSYFDMEALCRPRRGDSISPFKALIWDLTNLKLTAATIADIDFAIPTHERKLEARTESYVVKDPPAPEEKQDERDTTGEFFDAHGWVSDDSEDYLRRTINFRCIKGMMDEWFQATDEEKDFKVYATQFRQEHGLETQPIGPLRVAKKHGTTIEEEFLIY